MKFWGYPVIISDFAFTERKKSYQTRKEGINYSLALFL